MANKTSTAVSSDSLEIPLIDFNSFLSGDETIKKVTAQAILSGFQSAGFIYLKNHPMSRSTVQKTFEQSAAFFRRPEDQKLSLAWTTPEANRGYSKPGQEKTSNAMDLEDVAKQREEEGADLKESFEIGRENEPGHPNSWPDSFDDDGKRFKAHMLEFFDLCKGMHVEVMRAIAVGLGIEEKWFDSYTDGGDNTLRLLHYPEVKSEVFKNNKNTVRAGAHSDYGSITLVSNLPFLQRCLTDSMLSGAALPRSARRPANHVAERQFRRCHAHRRHHRRQRRRSTREMVQRHHQEHRTSRGGASIARRSPSGTIQHRILLQPELQPLHRCHPRDV